LREAPNLSDTKSSDQRALTPAADGTGVLVPRARVRLMSILGLQAIYKGPNTSAVIPKNVFVFG
jgi:ribosomal protein S5